MPDNDWMAIPRPQTKDDSWMKIPRPLQVTGNSYEDIGGVTQQGQEEDYNFQMKFGQDNDLLRAQRQSSLSQAGLMIGNGVSNIFTGLIEGLGYIPELWDNDHDYSNALTRKMQEFHNPLGEIHREKPNETFDLGDPAWWFSNIQQLGESAGAFAIEGIGLAKIFGGLAKGASELVHAGKLGMSVARGAAQTATAATLAYTEGAMSGYRIYDEVFQSQYTKLLRQGKTPEAANGEARNHASEAAASVVRTNTALNTILNIGELAPLFRAPKDEVLSVIRNQLARQEGESLAKYSIRLATSTADMFPQLKARHGFTSALAEMGKEGIEEVNTQYAEAKGRRIGNRQLVDGIGDLSNYINDVSNSEGALNFILGFIGGGVQTAIVDHVPSKYTTFDANNEQHVQTDKSNNIEQDKNGKPVYKKFLVSPKTFNERSGKDYFENIKDAVKADVDKQESLHSRLMIAQATGNKAEVERVKAELFSIGSIDSVRKGLADNWVEEYKQIHQTDNEKDLGEAMQSQIDESAKQLLQAQEQGVENLEQLATDHGKLITQQQELMGKTEAIQKGLTASKDDNDYKRTALDAQVDLKHLQQLHNRIQEKYKDTDNPMSAELTDHLFFRQADLYLRKRAIDKEEARLNAAEAMDSSMFLSEEAFTREINKYNDHLSIWNKVIDDLNTDVTLLKEGDKRVLKEMIAKYRAKGNTDEETVTDLIRKIEGKQKQYRTSVDAAKDGMESSSGFAQWKLANPEGTMKDYTNRLSENSILKNDKANLEFVKAQHEIAAQNFEEIVSQKGITDLYKSLADDRKKLVSAMNERNKQDTTAAFLTAQSREAAARIPVQERQALIDKLTAKLNDLKGKFNEAEQQRVSAEERLKGILYKSFQLNTQIKVRQEITLIKNKIASLRAQINELERQLDLLQTKKEEAQVVHQAVVQKNEEVSQSEQEEINELAGYETTSGVTDNIQVDEENDRQESFFTADELIASPTNTDVYLDLKEVLPKEAIKLLDKQEATGAFSYDTVKAAMRPLLMRGAVTQSEVNNILITMPKYMDERANPIKAAEILEAEQVQSSEIDLVPEIIESEQPMLTDNGNLFSEENLTQAFWENSAKTVDAVKGNSSDLQYVTIEKSNGLRMLRNKTVDGAPQLDTTTNQATMIPNYLYPGREVYLQIDTDWKGNVIADELKEDEDSNVINQKDKFADYTDKKGKIRIKEHESHIGYGNVPIKIVDAKTGETLKYFPRVNWITMTQGAGNYRNVEDMTTDADGNKVPGNVELQTELNLRIRKRLVEMWNSNPDAKLKTVVSQVSGGRIMYHSNLNENTGKMKYKVQLADKLLPDPSLKFAVANRSGIMVGKDTQAEFTTRLTDIQKERLMGTEASPRSSAVVLVPLANGTFSPQPLMTVPLSKRGGEVNTMLRAIELYMQFDGEKNELITKIESATGFDVSTPAGLKGFIEQYYTYTTGFSDSRLVANELINGKKIQRFMLDIPTTVNNRQDGKADIKLGTLFSGMNKGIRADLKDGKLNQKFVDAFISGIGQRFKTVAFTDNSRGVKGINDPNPIRTVSIDKNDKLSTKNYSDYNSYLKSFVSTSVYGQHQVKDPRTGQMKYVYAANAQMHLNAADLNPSAVQNARELISTPAEAGTISTEPQDAADILDAFGDFENGSVTNYVKHTIQADGPEVTLESLTQLHNFTATEDRNSLSPQEALIKLQGLGISRIADGYNPFKKC